MRSIAEYASQAGVSPRAVRLRAASGHLAAHKVGGRWVIEAKPEKSPRGGGRRLSAHSFDVLADFLDGEEQRLSADQRRRAKERALKIRALGIDQVKRYAERPDLHVERFKASGEDFDEISSRGDIAPTGISHPLAEVYGSIVDAYVSRAVRDEIELFHLLEPAEGVEANVVLRVQDPPPKVRSLHVIADLLGDPNARSRSEAERLFRRMMGRAG